MIFLSAHNLLVMNNMQDNKHGLCLTTEYVIGILHSALERYVVEVKEATLVSRFFRHRR